MKNSKLMFVVLLMIIMLSSCYRDTGNNGLFNCIRGEGDVVTQELIMNEFRGIKLRGSSQVFITQGDFQEVIVEGQQNIIDNIELDIQDQIWEIEFEDCMKDYTTLKFYITMPDIDRLEVSGSGDIFGDNDFAMDDMYLKISGSGSININATTTEMETKISGSGKIFLSGTTDKLKSKISGSGDTKAFDFEANIADIDIAGSGDAEVFVNENLDIKITGSGDVFYKGFPTLDVSITGNGDVNNAN